MDERWAPMRGATRVEHWEVGDKMNVRTAIDFAPLVGKYVDMSRPATSDELASGHPKIIGGAGLVVRVADAGPGMEPGVTIEWDYGMGFFIPAGAAHHWRFEVCDQQVALTNIQQQLAASGMDPADAYAEACRQTGRSL